MYILLLFLVLLVYLYYNKRYKQSRYYQLIKQFPSLLFEIPVMGSLWKVYKNPEALMITIANEMTCVTRVGGAARVYLFTIYYIVLTDAYDVGVALKTCLRKDYLYSLLRTITGNGSVFVSGSLAKKRRAVIMQSFHPRILYGFVDVFSEESIRLVDSLAPHAGAGPFSVTHYLYKYNVMTAIRAGLDKFDREVYDTDEFFEALMTWEKTAADRAMTWWKHSNFLYKFSSDYNKAKWIVDILHKYAQMILNQRTEEIKKHQIEAEEQKPDTTKSLRVGYFDSVINSHLNEEEKREEIIILILATDLASMTMTMGYTLMLLGQYPEVQERVYAELLDVFGVSDRPITKEDLGRLDYLDMVIKESMRLFPPVPAIVRRVDKDLTLPSGKTIPAGSGMFAGIWAVHRNPKYWGDDADSFDPERFSPERFKNIPPQAFIPFSYGPRNCVGYKYGQILIKVALSTVLRKYKIIGKPAEGPEPKIRTTIRIFMKAQNDFQIELIKRN